MSSARAIHFQITADKNRPGYCFLAEGQAKVTTKVKITRGSDLDTLNVLFNVVSSRKLLVVVVVVVVVIVIVVVVVVVVRCRRRVTQV